MRGRYAVLGLLVLGLAAACSGSGSPSKAGPNESIGRRVGRLAGVSGIDDLTRRPPKQLCDSVRPVGRRDGEGAIAAKVRYFCDFD